MQHGVTSAVSGGARTKCWRPLTEFRGHSAEGSLINLAVLGPGERHAVVLEFVDRGWCIAAHVLDCVLIAEPIGTFDCVVHVPAPVISPHVAERSGNTALRCDSVRAGWEHLRD